MTKCLQLIHQNKHVCRQAFCTYVHKHAHIYAHHLHTHNHITQEAEADRHNHTGIPGYNSFCRNSSFSSKSTKELFTSVLEFYFFLFLLAVILEEGTRFTVVFVTEGSPYRGKLVYCIFYSKLCSVNKGTGRDDANIYLCTPVNKVGRRRDGPSQFTCCVLHCTRVRLAPRLPARNDSRVRV